MKTASGNTIDYLNKKTNLKKLQQMQETINYEHTMAASQETDAAEKKFFWFLRLTARMDESGESIIKAGENSNPADNEHLQHGFHFGTLTIAGLDFVRIPFIYFMAYILNKKVPINLNNNARWLYSGVLLGLTIAALAIPPIAPIIAFVSAGIGIGASVFLLGKTLYQRYNLGRERKKINAELAHEEREMLAVQQEAYSLEHQLTQASEEQHIIAIYQEMAGVIERYDHQRIKIQELKNKSIHVEEQLKEVGAIRVADRSLSLIFASLTVIGLVLSLFFPPIGLGILAGTAIAGSAYFVARLTIPLLISFGQWIRNQFKSSPAPETEQTTESPELNNEHLHESTTDVMCGLMEKNEAMHTLQAEHDPSVWEEGDPAAPKVEAPIPQVETPTLTEAVEAEDTNEEGESERRGEHL